MQALRLSTLWAPIALAGLAACGGDGGEDPSGPTMTELDPDVAPVTQGTWYRPARDVTWQWQLQGTINTGYDVELYDIDLFETPDAVISALHARGAKVMCYFSAGSSESWRPDFADIPASTLGKQLAGHPSERWLDIRSRALFDVMVGRLDLAVQRGCDAVEPDNVDGYTNDTGFPLTARDQLAFNRNLANAARTRGLGVALKNDGDQAVELVDYYDLELNEQCHQYEECDTLQIFLDRTKPVLNAEYPVSATAAESMAQVVCPAAQALGLRTLILPLDLDDSFRRSCF